MTSGELAQLRLDLMALLAPMQEGRPYPVKMRIWNFDITTGSGEPYFYDEVNYSDPYIFIVPDPEEE